MNSAKPSPDDEWGTDYEGRIGIGGKGFLPLVKHPMLDKETQENLIVFQNSLPPNICGFVYEGLVKGRYWMEYPFVVLAHKTIGTQPFLLTLVIVLGRQYSVKSETTGEVIAEITDQAYKTLLQNSNCPVELLIIHRDELVAYLTELWLAEDGGKDLFYRLR